MNEFLNLSNAYLTEEEINKQFKELKNEDQIDLLVHSLVKEEVDNEEEEEEEERKKVQEEENEEFKMPQYSSSISDELCDITLSSNDGKSVKAHKAIIALQSKKLFELAKEGDINFKCDGNTLDLLIKYCYTKDVITEDELKTLDKHFSILEKPEEEKKKIDEERINGQKEFDRVKEGVSSGKFEWETIKTSGNTVRTLIDKSTLQVQYTSCYNKVFLNPALKKNTKITISVSGTDDTHGYIGICNESFDLSTCMCLTPPNAFFLNSSGQTCISGTSVSSVTPYKPSSKPTVKMVLDVTKKTITFNDKETHKITGTSWRFFVGKCNSDCVTYKFK